MAYDDRTPDTDPDPTETAGLERGGGVAPDDTPPMADSMSQSTTPRDLPNQGPVSGNRTPMIITLSILALVVLAAAGFTIASLVAR